ncbi:MAG: chromo domain-like protein [Olpidium bornovanus]|uniref:Chromo domain-like protein n=1 Tax=Olpidium bornovanus TaxID=278681 RepID=A0A8H7ZZT6_9FUNG|nr:MAG: chromo domain-like protein [Olpidium bornovanus]
MIDRSGINLRNTTLAAKYRARYFGPYRVEEVLANDNYRLDMPTGVRLHPVFHTSILRSYRNPAEIPVSRAVSRPDPINAAGDDFEVERVVGQRQRQGRTQYLVRWTGYDASEDTWEPAEHLRGARQAVRELRAQETVLDIT